MSDIGTTVSPEDKMRNELLRNRVEQCIDAGHYAVFAFRVTEGKLLGDYDIHAFPDGDFIEVVKQVHDAVSTALKKGKSNGQPKPVEPASLGQEPSPTDN